jgi:hypothetical protein
MGEPDASSFTLATHNGTITLHHRHTGAQYTFQVITVLGGGLIGKRLVKVLIGVDPRVFQSWITVGIVINGRVQLWKRWDTPTYQGYARLVEEPMTYRQRGYEYTVDPRCRRCNGLLTDERSLAAGCDGICRAYVTDVVGGQA